MESSLIKKNKLRKKRALRVRQHLRGTGVKPRLSVFVSNKYVYAQLIDDENHRTVASCSSFSKEMKDKAGGPLKQAAKEVGVVLGKLAKDQDIEKAVFDRGFKKFHGVLAALKEGVNEAGLKV